MVLLSGVGNMNVILVFKDNVLSYNVMWYF